MDPEEGGLWGGTGRSVGSGNCNQNYYLRKEPSFNKKAKEKKKLLTHSDLFLPHLFCFVLNTSFFSTFSSSSSSFQFCYLSFYSLGTYTFYLIPSCSLSDPKSWGIWIRTFWSFSYIPSPLLKFSINIWLTVATRRK